MPMIEIGQWIALIVAWVLALVVGASFLAVLFDPDPREYPCPVKLCAWIAIITFFFYIGGAVS
ncbi:MAG: hypothetical protein ACWGQW_00185 [bacterium]